MRAVIKNIGEKGKIVEIENELEPLQKVVGGSIEVLPLPNDMVLICNEMGKVNNLPLNFVITFGNYVDAIVGNAIFMGDSKDHTDFIDLSDEQIELLHYARIFSIE